MSACAGYDLNAIIHDVSNLAHLLGAVQDALGDIRRDVEQRPDEARLLDRAESLTVVAGEMAERIAEQTNANFARLTRPRIAA